MKPKDAFSYFWNGTLKTNTLPTIEMMTGVCTAPHWWRRGESNPRPKAFQQELLRAQTVIAAFRPFPLPGGKPSRLPVG